MSRQQAITDATNVFRRNGQGAITGLNSGASLTQVITQIYADLASAGVVAELYSESQAYQLGEYCVYVNPENGEGRLYKSNIAISNPEPWNPEHWTETSVAEILTDDSDIIAEISEELAEHKADNNNPHSVTKSQIGLGNADNTADIDKPISTATQTAIDNVEDKIDEHKADTDNPHNVTKSQVGLGNADNTSDLDKPISNATAQAIDNVAEDLAEHIADTENPHEVTKTQIGLGNADNTSDLDKPISNATAQALATKQDNNATLLSAWKATYGNLDLAISSLTQLGTFITDVLSRQSNNDYTSIAPFQGVMVKVHAFPSDHLLALSWTWAGEHYAISRNSGLIVKQGIEEAYTPDYNIDFNTDFRI